MFFSCLLSGPIWKWVGPCLIKIRSPFLVWELQCCSPCFSQDFICEVLARIGCVSDFHPFSTFKTFAVCVQRLRIFAAAIWSMSFLHIIHKSYKSHSTDFSNLFCSLLWEFLLGSAGLNPPLFITLQRHCFKPNSLRRRDHLVALTSAVWTHPSARDPFRYILYCSANHSYCDEWRQWRHRKNGVDWWWGRQFSKKSSQKYIPAFTNAASRVLLLSHWLQNCELGHDSRRVRSHRDTTGDDR